MEAIHALMVARRSAAENAPGPLTRPGALILTGPGDLRARFTRHTPAALVTGLASLRPRPVTYPATPPASRCANWGGVPSSWMASLGRLDELIVPLVAARAPGLLALYGIGPRTAALLLIAAGDHPGTAPLRGGLGAPVGAAPIPASSGKVDPPPAQPRR